MLFRSKQWTPFQLNLPAAPVTDLKVYKGNLIAATSGRGFWILDDLSLIRQYKADAAPVALYQPAPAYLANGGSELNGSDADFKGASTSRGVNPANGIVLYYSLPELKKDDEITLEITTAAGAVVRTFSSKKAEGARKWDGGPSPDPTLPKNKGLNRFVWNMRHATIPGVPNVYIEASYAGHKASPGKYHFVLKMGDQKVAADASILANPLYTVTAEQYKEYDTVKIGRAHV